MKISVKSTLCEKLDWLYTHAGDKWDKGIPMKLEDDASKLFVALQLKQGVSSNKMKWVVDWGQLMGMTAKDGGVEWKERAKRIDHSDTPRAKAYKPDYSMFAELKPEWFDPALSDLDNVKRIYEQHSAIVHRDKVAESRKIFKQKPIKGEEAIIGKQSKIVIDMLKHMAAKDCEVVLNYLCRAQDNKTSNKGYFPCPEWMKDYAQTLVEYLTNPDVPSRVASDHMLMTKLGFTGAIPCSYVAEYNRQGDVKYLSPSEYLTMEDFIGLPNATKITLGWGDIRMFSRISDVEPRKIKLVEVPVSHAAFPFFDINGDSIMSKGKLSELLVENWNSHSKLFAEWLRTPGNFKAYHCYRDSTYKTWRFNYSAICISIFKDTGFLLNPLALQYLMIKKPSSIEGSPLLTQGGVSLVINADKHNY